eukprot:g4127.t1
MAEKSNLSQVAEVGARILNSECNYGHLINARRAPIDQYGKMKTFQTPYFRLLSDEDIERQKLEIQQARQKILERRALILESQKVKQVKRKKNKIRQKLSERKLVPKPPKNNKMRQEMQKTLLALQNEYIRNKKEIATYKVKQHALNHIELSGDTLQTFLSDYFEGDETILGQTDDLAELQEKALADMRKEHGKKKITSKQKQNVRELYYYQPPKSDTSKDKLNELERKIKRMAKEGKEVDVRELAKEDPSLYKTGTSEIRPEVLAMGAKAERIVEREAKKIDDYWNVYVSRQRSRGLEINKAEFDEMVAEYELEQETKEDAEENSRVMKEISALKAMLLRSGLVTEETIEEVVEAAAQDIGDEDGHDWTEEERVLLALQSQRDKFVDRMKAQMEERQQTIWSKRGKQMERLWNSPEKKSVTVDFSKAPWAKKGKKMPEKSKTIA